MHCLRSTQDEIEISLSKQELTYAGQTYPISSSKYGIGSQEGSNKTPLGRFQISECHGSGDAPYSIYKARVCIGCWDRVPPESGTDMILSRILRFSGLDSANHNTYARYIYVHGTNDEEHLGTPHSIGCIRMHNLDIIELYNQVSLGTVVQINP